MEIGRKRYKKKAQICEKRKKGYIELRGATKFYLRKELWLEILKYLDTCTFLTVIPQINHFFYDCSKECRKHLFAIQASLHMEKHENSKQLTNFNDLTLDLMKNARCIERLKLNIVDYGVAPKLARLNKLPQALSDMPWVGNLRELEFNINEYNNTLIKSLFNKLISLETLKLTMDFYFPIGLSYIFLRFIDKDGLGLVNLYQNGNTNDIPFTPLKKISINYSNYYTTAVKGCNIFSTLNKNSTLEHFALNFQAKVPEELSLSPSFTMVTNLKSIEISPAFTFTQQAADAFCNFLAENQTIKSLKISETIIRSSELLAKAFHTNKTLTTLSLEPYLPDSGFSFKIEVMFELIKDIQHSCLTEFTISSDCIFLNYEEISETESIATISQKNGKKFVSKLHELLLNWMCLKVFKLKIDTFPIDFIRGLEAQAAKAKGLKAFCVIGSHLIAMGESLDPFN